MGNTTNNGGIIVFVPGGKGQPSETIGAGMSRRGETISDTLNRIKGSGGLPRGAKYLPLSGQDVAAYGGSAGFSDADISDFTGQLGGAKSVGGKLVRDEARGVRAGGANRISGEETRAAANVRRATNRVAALKTEQRAAQTRVRQLKTAGRSERTIRSAEKAVATLRDQIKAQQAIAKG